jgi:hypothetical protein
MEFGIRIYSAIGPSTNGWMDSSILYLGCDPSWGTVSWEASVPLDASLGVQVRASDDPDDMGAWSTMLTSPGSLSGILQDNDSFLQYRLVMTSGPSGMMPALSDISFGYSSLGTGDGDGPSAFELRVTPDPCLGVPSVQVGLPSAETVELGVYDVAGRLVQAPSPVQYQPGWHTVALGELRAGVYYVRVRAGEHEAAVRFVSLE